MLTIDIKVFLKKEKTKSINMHVYDIDIFLKKKKTKNNKIDVNYVENKNKN